MERSELQWTWVSTTVQLDAFLQRHSQCKRCFVDLEADSLHRYEEQICLIQVESEGEIALIDPLSAEIDVTAFYRWLLDREVWMHGADYDMRLLQNAGAQLPQPLLDTQIAAQLVGRKRFGLAALIAQEFEITLSKTSQKADWRKRPLTDQMLKYAALDVFFLPDLVDRLLAELEEKKRYDWFLESCEFSRLQGQKRLARDPETIWRVSGWGKLSSLGLGYLKVLWHWRERCAKSWDRPSFYIANNATLISWATELSQNKVVDFAQVRPRWKKDLYPELAEVAQLSEQQLPQKRLKERLPRRDEQWEKCVDALKAHRNNCAKSLDIDPGVIASRATLEALVTAPEKQDQLLLSWQREVLGNWQQNLI